MGGSNTAWLGFQQASQQPLMLVMLILGLIMHDCVLHDLAIKDMGLWLRGLGRSRLGLGVIVVCMGMPEVGVSEFIAFVFVWFCHGIEQNDTPAITHAR